MDPNYYSNYIQQLQQQAQLAQPVPGQPQQQQAQLTPEQIQQQQYYYYYYYMQQMNAAAQPQNAEVSNNITPELTNASSPTIVTDSVDKKAADKGKVEKTDENSNNANDGTNKSKRVNKIPIYKDRKTMNLDERLYRGITKSAYYSSLRYKHFIYFYFCSYIKIIFICVFLVNIQLGKSLFRKDVRP